MSPPPNLSSNPFPIPWLHADHVAHSCAHNPHGHEDANTLIQKAVEGALTTLDPEVSYPFITSAGFDEYENLLTALLADLTEANFETLLDFYRPVLVNDAQNWGGPLADANLAASRFWRSKVQTIIPQAKAMIRAAVFGGMDQLDNERLKGELGLPDGTVISRKDDPIRVDDVVDALTRSFQHYSEDWFDAHIIPMVLGEVERIIALTPSTYAPAFAPIIDLISGRLEQTAYFRLVANATASRAFHYGYLSVAHRQGYREYIFQARLDSHTSDICRYLHGTRWTIRDVIPSIEAAARAETTDDLKAAHPWFQRNPNVFIGDDAARYTAANIPWPPLHGHCRSSIKVFNKPATPIFDTP